MRGVRPVRFISRSPYHFFERRARILGQCGDWTTESNRWTTSSTDGTSSSPWTCRLATDKLVSICHWFAAESGDRVRDDRPKAALRKGDFDAEHSRSERAWFPARFSAHRWIVARRADVERL